MKIFFSDQRHRFPRHLSDLKKARVMPYDKAMLPRKTSQIAIEKPWSEIRDKAASLLLDYNVFPQSILIGYGEWTSENRTMQPGDTIVQQVYLPPFRFLSAKLIFGVRVTEAENTRETIRFSYETLEGHAEKGLSSFILEPFGDISVFRIETYSSPGHILSQIGGPFFTRPYQAFCTRKALRHVKGELESVSS